MIKLQVIGNLGADAEIKSIAGREYISFRVANTKKRTDKDGVIHDDTIWVSCLMPNYSVTLAKYLTKGTKVYVEGEPRFRTYKATKDNVTGYFVSIDLMVSTLELCGDNKQKQSNDPMQANDNVQIF